jgi:hypothetical protein
MSRGLGKLQRYLLDLISHQPMTFAEMRAIAHGDDTILFTMMPQPERSLRRALRKLIDDGAVATTGTGGPRSPFRYHLRPAVLFFGGGAGEYTAHCEAMEKEEPGSAGRAMAAIMPR